MLTNIVRAFCLLIDVGAVVAISVVATRRVTRWRRSRRPGLPRPIVEHHNVRVIRSTSPDSPVR